VQELSAQKKYVDFELLFSQEARDFRSSSEFSDLIEEFALEPYWENWRGPDEG